MKYEVHVAPHSGGEATRFELERGDEEPLNEGDSIHQLTMIYRVERVVPLSVEESDEFDARVDAVWMAGPAQAGYYG